MAQELSDDPRYRGTMDRLESAKHTSSEGVDYWRAREIHTILGYPIWDKFEPVIDRARGSLRSNGVDPQHHIAQTSNMMGVGKGAQRQVVDYYLSRAACYLITMNGDPSKPEIAAGQAYFAIQTRRMELREQEDVDAKRLELRGKVSRSFKKISGIAKGAGVSSRMQGIFHDARYHGLYGMSGKDVKRRKGISGKDNIFDFAGPLELSANDFQMNLAAEVITREGIRGQQRVIDTNRDVGLRVRKAMRDSNATMPEDLPLEGPIKEVVKRLKGKKKIT